MPKPLVLLLGLVAALCSTGSQAAKPQQDRDVIILTEDNFDQETASGVWVIDIYAPWCSHCQQLEPTWHAFATEMKEHDVKVAKIDGTKNKVLLRRFAVAGFPSIYLLRKGQTWQYNGMRTVKDLKEFTLRAYKKSTPLPFHKAPNSLLGRAIGLLHSLPSLAKRGYLFLKEEKGFSDMAIISGVLLIPLLLGAVFICILDAMYTRQQGFDEHQHYE